MARQQATKPNIHVELHISVTGHRGSGDVRQLMPAADAVMAGAYQAYEDWATANMAIDEPCTIGHEVKLRHTGPRQRPRKVKP